ncbi:MAG: RNA polymerase-binding protein DksA, partial [Ottowia sp.]|nr:RNA polymerase-binding protein DksA [Ottowia sp.]
MTHAAIPPGAPKKADAKAKKTTQTTRTKAAPAVKGGAKAATVKTPAKKAAAPVKTSLPVKKAAAKKAAPVKETPAKKAAVKKAAAPAKAAAQAKKAAVMKAAAPAKAAAPEKKAAVNKAAAPAKAAAPEKKAAVKKAPTSRARKLKEKPSGSTRRRNLALADNWKSKKAEELSDEEILAMSDDNYMNRAQLRFFRHRLESLRASILSKAGQTVENLRD